MPSYVPGAGMAWEESLSYWISKYSNTIQNGSSASATLRFYTAIYLPTLKLLPCMRLWPRLLMMVNLPTNIYLACMMLCWEEKHIIIPGAIFLIKLEKHRVF